MPKKTITISGVPPALIKEIDRLAGGERRNRSNWIVGKLTDAVEKCRFMQRPQKTRSQITPN